MKTNQRPTPNLGSNFSSVIENLEDNFAASLEFKDNFPGSLELSDRDSFAEASDQEKGRDALYNISSGSQSTMDFPCHFSVPRDAVGCAAVPCIHSDHMTDSCPDKKNKAVDDMYVDDSLEFSEGGIRWSDEESLSDLEEYLSSAIHCGLCGKDDHHFHTNCPYLESVPLNANISSGAQIVCGNCASRIGKDLFCSFCNCRVRGYAVRKHCAFCDLYFEHTTDDCPYANKPELLEPGNYIS